MEKTYDEIVDGLASVLYEERTMRRWNTAAFDERCDYIDEVRTKFYTLSMHDEARGMMPEKSYIPDIKKRKKSYIAYMASRFNEYTCEMNFDDSAFDEPGNPGYPGDFGDYD